MSGSCFFVSVYLFAMMISSVDFKPASIDALKPAVIDIQQGNKVTVTVPHIEVR